MNKDSSDAARSPLMKARLLYHQGQHEAARQILEELLAAHPGSSEAKELLLTVEKEMAATAGRRYETKSEAALEGGRFGAAVLALVSIGILAFGVAALMDALGAIQQVGFEGTVKVRGRSGGSHEAPAHNLLIFPVLFLLIGSGGCYFAYRNWRNG